MKFLVDRCAGRRLADWLRANQHDVLEARELGPDPGDAELLRRAVSEERCLVTIDTDFGELVFLGKLQHAGLIRLPDVPSRDRIKLLAAVIKHHRSAIEERSVITLKGDRVRISRPR